MDYYKRLITHIQTMLPGVKATIDKSQAPYVLKCVSKYQSCSFQIKNGQDITREKCDELVTEIKALICFDEMTLEDVMAHAIYNIGRIDVIKKTVPEQRYRRIGKTDLCEYLDCDTSFLPGENIIAKNETFENYFDEIKAACIIPQPERVKDLSEGSAHVLSISGTVSESVLPYIYSAEFNNKVSEWEEVHIIPTSPYHFIATDSKEERDRILFKRRKMYADLGGIAKNSTEGQFMCTYIFEPDTKKLSIGALDFRKED